MSGRVVIIGPDATAAVALEKALKINGNHVVIADDVRHTLLLLRSFVPDVIVSPHTLSEGDVALLLSSSSTPLVLTDDVGVEASMALLRQGVARVVPMHLGQPVLCAVVDAPLRIERPVQRALGQLGLLKGTGALEVGLPLQGEIVVDEGQIHHATAGTLTGLDAIKRLATLEGPLHVRFVGGEQLLTDVEVDVDMPDRTPSGDIILDDIDLADMNVDGGTEISVQRAPQTMEELAVLLPPTVLVVEDDPDLARLYALLLKSRGFITTIAHDGADAYAAACSARYDVVLSDIMMPRQTGWDLLSLIRNNARLRETRVVLLSHYAEMVTRLKSANGGADGYLQKSLRPEAVVAAVIEVIRPRRELAAILAADAGRVEGSLASIGPQTLLRMLAKNEVTGRLAVRSGTTRYLLAFESGDVVDAQCSMGTATLHHRDALRAMLLADDGNFIFVSGPAPATAPPTAVEPLLDGLCAELELLLENLRTDVLSAGTPLSVRQELLEVYRASSPNASRIVIDKLGQGMPPREIIIAGLADPVLVDSIVRDLFRKGVVTP